MNKQIFFMLIVCVLILLDEIKLIDQCCIILPRRTLPNGARLTSSSVILTNTLVPNYISENSFYGSLKEIISIDTNAFRNYCYLTHVDLSWNQLSYIEEGTFDSLINLRYLYLDGNVFTNMKDMAIYNLPLLLDLSLSFNKLQQFKLNELNNSPNLTTLYLHYNRIVNINLTSLHRQIDRLEIDGNRISNIDATNVQFKNSLDVLWASQNHITDFSLISSLPNLSSLHIDAKSPQYLLPNHFKESKLMKMLDLYNVDDYIFQNFCSYLNNLPNLKTLNFHCDDSEVLNLSLNAFNCDNKLTSLSILNSKLKTIPNGFFSRFTQLKFLNLASNQLDHLDSNVFQGATSLKQVYLYDNKLNDTYKNILYYNFTGFPNIPFVQFKIQ
jgi:Leucine-rich repeat (LRR) protein